MEITEVLKQFGLKSKETTVYLSALELGTTTVSQIAKKARIKRTTVYDILDSLIAKGLIGQTQKGKKRYFYAEDPEKLHKLLEEKEEKLAEVMPLLKSIYNVSGTKPKIRYYEGKEGLKDVYRDTLIYKGEMQAFVSEDVLKYLGEEFMDEYFEKRIKNKIFVKVIGPDTAEIKKYKAADKKGMKTTRIVDKKKYPFSIEMNIYGNKVALMSFREEMGIIIESNEIAKNMIALFNLAWKGAKK